MKTLTKEMQQELTPEQSLSILVEGNKRFTQNISLNRNFLEQAKETEEGQYPFGVILSCIDSRASSAIIFDQGIGDIFSIKIAGNVVNEDILGSMEFSCKLAGSKVIVVLGHTHCGAVKGACDDVKMGNLTCLLDKIKPSVKGETITKENRNSTNKDFVFNVTQININKSIKDILDKSSILREMVDAGEIKIVGGIHDISNGQVTFFND